MQKKKMKLESLVHFKKIETATMGYFLTGGTGKDDIANVRSEAYDLSDHHDASTHHDTSRYADISKYAD